MRHRRVNIVLALLAAAACGGPPKTVPAPVASGPVAAPPPRATTVDSVFALESSGSQPEDTVVAVAPGRGRTIVLRREPPDNSLFARLVLAGGAATAGDSVRVSIKPRPGLYGIDLTLTGPTPASLVLSLSYAVHFVAPAGARARYGTDLEYEKALFVARAFPDGRLEFLPTTRPGSDLIEAVLPGPGRYLVAAPRW